MFTFKISESSGETESINISSEDSSSDLTEDTKDKTLKPKRNPKLVDKDKNPKPTETNESHNEDAKKPDNKGSTENTQIVGNDDKTKSSGKTPKSVKQRCKSAKSDTKVSSTPKSKVDRGKKYANDDDDPIFRDEIDLDGTIQESGNVFL